MAELNYKALGQRIRSARQHRGMTQDSLGEACGLSTAHIGHIERGTRIPSLDTLFRIACTLEVSVDSLLLDSASTVTQVFSAISAELVRKDSAQAARFLTTVKALADKIDEL